MHCRGFWICLVAALSLLAVACTGDAFSSEIVVVTFGDSTTAPRGPLVVYSTLVQNKFAAKGVPAKVINAGTPGNTTTDARARLEKDVIAHAPDVAVVQFGINDAAVDVWKTPPAVEPRVPQKQYEDNLRFIVRTLQRHNAVVVLMTPNPCHWTPELLKHYGKHPYRPDDSEGFNVLLSDYAEIIRRLARQDNTALVDVYAAFETYAKSPRSSLGDLLLDGMHPNARGHELVATLLLASKPIHERLEHSTEKQP